MDNEFKENKLYEIFIDAEDFCKSLEKGLAERGLSLTRNDRKVPQPHMSASEILTIICFYQHSGYKNFQYYCEVMVLKQMISYFPNANGDKGYLTKLFEKYYTQGIQIITKLRKNMKNKLMQFTDKLWLRKRAVIESVNDILMTVFDIDHTRHRSPVNAMAHLIGGVIAYAYYDEKPSVFIPSNKAT